MALGIFLTTTGTLNPVVIEDMGGRTFPHPTTDYNLLDDVSEDEIQKSADLQQLINDGHVILKDDLGNIITDVQAAGPHKHPQGDIEQSGLTPGHVLTATAADAADFLPIPPPSLVAGEPMGFPNRSDSVVTWDDGTLTFTIAPAGASFDVWILGTKYVKSAPESLVGDGTDFTIAEGLWYFYYDNTGTLVASQTFWDLSNTAQVWMLYWDATNSKAITRLEERHGLVMDWATHKKMHLTKGTEWITGLLPGNILADQDGSLDTHAQLSITNGQIVDEDIFFDIIGGSPQVLSLPAQIPVLYKTGAAGLWRVDAVTTFPVKRFGPTNRLAYNQFTGGAWQQTEASNNDFVLAHIFALPEVNTPVFAVQGENTYGNIASAREGAEVELLALRTAGLPSAEWTPIATLIYQTSDSYANTVKARIRSTQLGGDFVDWRGSGISPAEGVAPNFTVFGNDYQREEQLVQASTTDSSPQVRVALTTPALTGTYRVAFNCFRANEDKAGYTDFYNLTDTTILMDFLTRTKINENYPHYDSAFEIDFTGSSKTFQIRYNDDGGGETQYIKGAYIELWRIR